MKYLFIIVAALLLTLFTLGTFYLISKVQPPQKGVAVCKPI
jgi:hypothetical protein